MTRVSFSLLSSQSCWFLVAEEAKTTVLTGMWLQACVVVVVVVVIILAVTVVIVIVVSSSNRNSRSSRLGDRVPQT